MAKPSSCSPKYSTMSLRSASPWTSTSRPSCSCRRIAPAFRLHDVSVFVGGISPALSCGAGGADSGVWGNEPMVVVGSRGKRSSSRCWSDARAGKAFSRAGDVARSGWRRAPAPPGCAPAGRRGGCGEGGAGVRMRRTAAGPRPSAAVSTASSSSFWLGEREPGFYFGVEVRPRCRDRTGTCSSEHDGATCMRSRRVSRGPAPLSRARPRDRFAKCCARQPRRAIESFGRIAHRQHCIQLLRRADEIDVQSGHRQRQGQVAGCRAVAEIGCHQELHCRRARRSCRICACRSAFARAGVEIECRGTVRRAVPTRRRAPAQSSKDFAIHRQQFVQQRQRVESLRFALAQQEDRSPGRAEPALRRDPRPQWLGLNLVEQAS